MSHCLRELTGARVSMRRGHRSLYYIDHLASLLVVRIVAARSMISRCACGSRSARIA
jgi:hypothetical protein